MTRDEALKKIVTMLPDNPEYDKLVKVIGYDPGKKYSDFSNLSHEDTQRLAKLLKK